MSYRSKTYTWNDVILVTRSMIRFFVLSVHTLMMITLMYTKYVAAINNCYIKVVY